MMNRGLTVPDPQRIADALNERFNRVAVSSSFVKTSSSIYVVYGA